MNANGVNCGGTILSATKILTAAHCYMDPSKLQVIVGEHSLVSATDGVRHNITSFEKHPSYNSESGPDNDIAIITLTKPIALGDKARVACLPKSATDPALTSGQLMTVSGWGQLSGNSQGPDVLHAVKVPFMTYEVCRNIWARRGREITTNMICAGKADGSANG